MLDFIGRQRRIAFWHTPDGIQNILVQKYQILVLLSNEKKTIDQKSEVISCAKQQNNVQKIKNSAGI